MSPRFLTSCCLIAALLAASAAQAGLAPARIQTSDIRLAAMGCGPGYRLDASGACVDYLDRSRICPPGLFAVSFPNGNGYRCVPTAWLNSRGWLGDFLGFR
jgi:hypothetical protein